MPAMPPSPSTAGRLESERVLVCISSHPLSERLVRTGRELAGQMGVEWDVVYVETPDRLRYSPSHSKRLARILQQAEEAGGRIAGISGRTVPDAVIEYAQKHNAVRIIVGKPLRPRWQEFFWPSPVNEILRRSAPAEVLVISEPSGPIESRFLAGLFPHPPLRRYIWAILLVALVSLVSIPIHFLIESTNLVMLYLLAVIVSAMFWGRGPSLLASLLGVVVFDFFFVDPRLSLTVADTQYIITFLGLLGAGLVVSSLAGMVQSQVESSRMREARTAMLYNLSRELTVTLDLDAVLNKIIEQVGQTIDREAALLLPESSGLKLRAANPGLVLGNSEYAAADWAFDTGHQTGPGTHILSESSVRWYPLQTSSAVVGVLGVRLTDPGSFISTEQRQLLEAYSSLAALAVERAALTEQASQNRLLLESEKLQTALLNSISHDLRTPLATITGVFSSLHEAEGEMNDMVLDHETRIELIDTGWQEAERLNRLVGNLLDMTRLEAGAIHLNREQGDIEDVIGAALTRMRRRLQDFKLITSIPPERTLVMMDFVLIEQVLVNLLDNAAKYSQSEGEIEIGVDFGQSRMRVWVSDRGQGIPESDVEHIFDKFYRSQDTGRHIGGTGLGLSICKGIVEAHGGIIRADNRKDGGAVVLFTLPLELGITTTGEQ
jgi:two-component system, OmpR family, sensor histidine kinase KdpD